MLKVIRTTGFALLAMANLALCLPYKPLFYPVAFQKKVERETVKLASDKAHKGCLDSLNVQLGPAAKHAESLARDHQWSSMVVSFNLGANYITDNYVIVGGGGQGASLFLGGDSSEAVVPDEDYARIMRFAETSQYESNHGLASPQDTGCRVLVYVSSSGIRIFKARTDAPGLDSRVINRFDGLVESLLED